MQPLRLILVPLTAIPLLLIAADKEKAPFRDKEPALKLFAEEFVAINPGEGKFPASFRRGTENGRKDEQPVHEVKIARPFAMAKYEVTQELYAAVMGKNPAKWTGPRNS